ncbi:MAG TPA: hypothetical protein PKL31_08540, partial [Fulvivirga sp.]|nr:hypothetical protein [Fulvivirga sp.]
LPTPGILAVSPLCFFEAVGEIGRWKGAFAGSIFFEIVHSPRRARRKNGVAVCDGAAGLAI